MDPRRFDDLTRAFARPHSRRTVLKVLAGATLGGLLAQRGRGAAAKDKPPKDKPPKKPKPCRPNGKHAKDPAECCSGITVDDVCTACLGEGEPADNPAECCSKVSTSGRCCGDVGGSCAVTECCVYGACRDGTCLPCFKEGSPAESADDCCSRTAKGDFPNLVCCGEDFSFCEVSLCCNDLGDTPFCHQGICVACLPEGTPSDDVNHCCSKMTKNGLCCAHEEFGSCAASGCCTLDSLTPFCVDGACSDCLPEGHETTKPTNCCSTAALFDVCCGEGGKACSESGCCASGFSCCGGVCQPQCPEGQTHNPDTCVCEEQTPGEDGDICADDADCLSNTCCNFQCTDTQADESHCGTCGNACDPGQVCIVGVCSTVCSDQQTICDDGTGCFCYPYRPDCICCGVCPAGSDFPIANNCRGGCGDCCKTCHSIGNFTCCGPFKNTLNPAEGCLEGPFY